MTQHKPAIMTPGPMRPRSGSSSRANRLIDPIARMNACQDDSGCSQSTITPTVTAGVTYTIVVDGYDGSEVGDFTLTVPPAP